LEILEQVVVVFMGMEVMRLITIGHGAELLLADHPL